MKKVKISFVLNGDKRTDLVNPNMRLLDYLRENCDCKSVKEGCSEGECGACTIVRNGEAVTSCCILVGQIQGDEIITTEGLSKNGKLSALQQAFVDAGAVQCGYCTPGMLMSSYALLIHNPYPTDEEIRVALSGNLCRCTGYKKIINAVRMAAEYMQKES